MTATREELLRICDDALSDAVRPREYPSWWLKTAQFLATELKRLLSQQQGELLPCPMCGSAPELIPGSGRMMPTLDETLLQPKDVRCSNGQCGLRYVPGGFTVDEWNTRTSQGERSERDDSYEAFRDFWNVDRHHPYSGLIDIALRGWNAGVKWAQQQPPTPIEQQPAQGVPDDVMYALERMCTPLDPSRLSGATASEDARCAKLIRDFVLRIAAPSPQNVQQQGRELLQALTDPENQPHQWVGRKEDLAALLWNTRTERKDSQTNAWDDTDSYGPSS